MLHIVVGAQWGDEGKGKIVDYLSTNADAVARYQGGNNAGHTVVVGNQTLKLHLLPSGVAAGKVCLLGNGMVVDPWALLRELDELKKSGLTPDFLISTKAHLILPSHLKLDKKQENNRGANRLGTTGRGIGPAYSDKAARVGLRAELLSIPRDQLYDEIRGFFQNSNGLDEYSNNKTNEECSKLTEELVNLQSHFKERIGDVSAVLRDLLRKGQTVVVEGAQGILLDLDHGTYPFCTSSNTVAPAACVGLGIPIWAVERVSGVVKAYTTRVGEGPFPTELTDEVSEILVERGKEFGTTTGRKRRCGWLDLVALQYANDLNGFTDLAITKLDVLSGLNPLKICIAYTLNGNKIKTFPANSRDLKRCHPVYKEFNGCGDLSQSEWDSVVRKGYSALPEELKLYLKFIFKSLDVPIKLISVGPERECTIVVPKAH
ncbi:MAG: adenylosuccinate synthase [Candidatus Heimdallarchaeota archaeon]